MEPIDKVRIGKAAEIIGVSKQTLKMWDGLGILVPYQKLPKSMHRYYTIEQLQNFIKNKLIQSST